MEELNAKLDFTDITLNEAEGKYKNVVKIMSEDTPFLKTWAIRSTLSITSQTGICVMEIQCHEDGSLYIIDYVPSSVGDVYYNPDIQILSEWSQKKGWKMPEPSESLVRSNKPFWKHFWDTLLIDSIYFDKIYGERDQLSEGSHDE
jgi:hypothetical protein